MIKNTAIFITIVYAAEFNVVPTIVVVIITKLAITEIIRVYR